MKRFLIVTFEVTDAAVSDAAVLELADRIIAEIAPNPPILVYESAELIREYNE